MGTMAAPARDLKSYASVKTWLQGLREQSGADPEADPRRLATLKEFCEFAGLDPDEAVRACLLLKEGRETRLSIKGRRGMAEKIAEFQERAPGLDRRARASRGNAIRSFLIHNGILLQAGIQV